jgi:hypothetical protein
LNERRQVAEGKGAGIEGITEFTERGAAMKIETNVKAGSDVKDSHDRYAN